MSKLPRYIIPIVTTLISCALLGLACLWMLVNALAIHTQATTEATIIDLVNTSDHKVAPVVTFIEPFGSYLERTEELEPLQHPWAYHIGDHIQIFYYSEKRGAPSVNSFWELWLWPTAILGMGMLGLIGSCVGWIMLWRKK